MRKPLFKNVKYIDPELVFLSVCKKSWVVWLDGHMPYEQQDKRSRYSYIACEPFDIMLFSQNILYSEGKKYNDLSPFSLLKSLLRQYSLDYLEGLPPLQTGVIGYWSYDLCHYLEPVEWPKNNDLQFPEIALGLYDVVIAFDNHEKKSWVISSGFPCVDEGQRLRRAEQRLDETLKHLSSIDASENNQQFKIIENEAVRGIVSNFNKESYIRAVERAIEYIRAGDIFEVNLSQRYSVDLPKNYDKVALYLQLRRNSPAPFSAYMNFDRYSILSASPERFIQLQDGHVETRPIKGTRPRDKDVHIDNQYASELLTSKKDRSENVMIVDLMRNDLSRVCYDDSVEVTQLCGLESFHSVHHLVSVVQGKLCDGMSAVDLLEATFPGGSITGAPKVRAMQIISELEPDARGPYCGSMGYIGFSGNMDTSIAIRTICSSDEKITYHGGGAVVLDSNPEEEYIETCVKVSAIQRVLTQNN